MVEKKGQLRQCEASPQSREVTSSQPCPVCGKHNYCWISTSGLRGGCYRSTAAVADDGVSILGMKTDARGTQYRTWTRRASDVVQSSNCLSLARPEDLDAVYRALSDKVPLSTKHRGQLHKRSLGDEQISRGWYSSWTRENAARYMTEAVAAALSAAEENGIDILTVPGFSKKNNRVVFRAGYGLLIPVRDVDGNIITLKVRLDKPTKRRGKYVSVSSRQYDGPSPGSNVHIPVFELERHETARITEGELKGDVTTALTGTLTVSVPGVQQFSLVLPVLEHLSVKRVYVAFDADWRTNRTVAESLFHLIERLERCGYEVVVETWSPTDGKGIDDVLVNGKRPRKLRGFAVDAFKLTLENRHGEFAPAEGVLVNLDADQHIINSRAADALSRSRRLYTHAGQIARIRMQTPRAGDGRMNKAKKKLPAPLIIPADPTLLADVLSREGIFERWNHRSKRIVLVDPPEFTVKFLHQNSDFCNLRELNGVVTFPILRDDGSIFNLRGFDARTGLYLDRPQPGLLSPHSVRAKNVRAAVERLKDVVRDFPFADDAGFSAWLSFALTLLTRHLYEGCTPLFLFEAAKSGTGKGLLVDAAMKIVLGRLMCRTAMPESDAEMRKVITSFLYGGQRAVLFDNIRDRIEFASLEAALTAEEWTDRLLGTNRTIQLAMNLLFVASANQPVLSPDLVRRTLSIQLESKVEHPDRRTEFKHPKLLGWISNRRSELLADLLTIARGYIQANRPMASISSWGSFGGWSDWIRQMVIWAGCADPADSRESLRERCDSESPALASLMHDLEQACNKEYLKRVFFARDVAGLILNSTSPNKVLHGQAIRTDLELFRPSLAKTLSAATLGKTFGSIAGRIEGGRRLVRVDRVGNTERWRVERVSENLVPVGDEQDPKDASRPRLRLK